MHNGTVIKNLYELLEGLKSMDENTFNYHVNDQKNDFCNWIMDIILDSKLAELLIRVKKRNIFIRIVEKHIRILERKAGIKK